MWQATLVITLAGALEFIVNIVPVIKFPSQLFAALPLLFVFLIILLQLYINAHTLFANQKILQEVTLLDTQTVLSFQMQLLWKRSLQYCHQHQSVLKCITFQPHALTAYMFLPIFSPFHQTSEPNTCHLSGVTTKPLYCRGKGQKIREAPFL